MENSKLEKIMRDGNVLELRKELEQGLNSNIFMNNSPLIRHVAYHNQPLLVKELLNHGADPDIPDQKRGMTALIDAAYKGYIDIINLVLPYVKNIDWAESEFGHTALMEAARSGELEIVKLLVQSGCNPNLRSKEGNTALDFAKSRNYEDIINYLEPYQFSN